jgi:hypothetical protein
MTGTTGTLRKSDRWNAESRSQLSDTSPTGTTEEGPVLPVSYLRVKTELRNMRYRALGGTTAGWRYYRQVAGTTDLDDLDGHSSSFDDSWWIRALMIIQDPY